MWVIDGTVLTVLFQFRLGPEGIARMIFRFDEENRKEKASAFTLKRNEDNEEARRKEAAENPNDGMDVDSDVFTDESSIDSADLARMAQFQILGEAGSGGGMEIDGNDDDYAISDDEGVSPEDMERMGQ